MEQTFISWEILKKFPDHAHHPCKGEASYLLLLLYI